ncbi:Nif3-like dinuclear metal center hexameric protein [Draconibacterium sp. IB214405]|uniref:Nif3-like dinuclear metal center hexameric protein n=1 Tax=Draconibacterium sp. IB214405 TaxID=3097352 RepID=UPI002A0EC362|nr:Nif3-like dinuclear metal center hexameric protein [Draconibacterium sp. IB214405]MDX8339112.1 Nif3-like dinuclear metal center hexameric protein [Draconibacterium sp. IB214405]
MKNFLLLLFLIPFASFGQNKLTPQSVVNLMKENVTCDWAETTVDVFKVGDPEAEIKGIAVCMFADMRTLQKAVEMNCNFIITHEPIFYNHLDNTDAYANDPVYTEKRKFIEDHKLVVFRFHDHIHMTQPDGIYAGMIDKLGWKNYAVNDEGRLYKMPEMNLADFASELKDQLGLQTVRVIGNPDMKFTKVGLAVGAPGGTRQIQMLNLPEVEVMVAGEASEWETYLYANDATTLGKNKAVIFLGHIKSEEAGMDYCAQWLKGFVKGVPIHFIENEANFMTF